LTEIERKFLVTSTDFISESRTQFRIVQGYLNSNPERTVRVRIKGDKGFLTIKGKGNESGMSRFEWEKEIAISEAEALLPLCEKVATKYLWENILMKLMFFQAKTKV
jgi:CYTH domain-containing protein